MYICALIDLPTEKNRPCKEYIIFLTGAKKIAPNFDCDLPCKPPKRKCQGRDYRPSSIRRTRKGVGGWRAEREMLSLGL